MFKNREFRVRMVKTNKKAEDLDSIEVPEDFNVAPEQISEIAKDFVKYTGIVVAAVFAASFVTHAACEIAVKLTKTR